jgi:group II intron reverse transcriptase/maturase
MTTKLDEIATKARSNPTLRFTSLAHLVTPAFLKETWQSINRRGAAGVDRETVEEFEVNLDERIRDLHARARRGAYRPPPVRRVEIPKGNGKTRALGIPTVEDRLLQAAVARVLSAVFEEDFLDVSFGYRPRRSAHDALRTLRRHLVVGKVMHIFEADIKSYFDKVNHDWLKRMLAHRIADPSILRLVHRWLCAGVMEGGVVLRTTEGVPQGGPISPLLANVYLHYCLDLWVEKVVKRHCAGYVGLVRYADDFVVCFQYEKDAMRFERALQRRLPKFGLTVAPEKTRRIVFGRFAKERLTTCSKKPCEFTFLGFRHICGEDRGGNFAVIRLPSQVALRRFRDRVRTWLWEHMHWKVRDHQKRLSSMLRGFYAYFALPHCAPKLNGVHNDVMRCWRKLLLRRSQRSKTHWSYLKKQKWFQLPTPVSVHTTV